MSHDPLPYTRVWLKAGLGDPAGRPPLGCMAEEGWLGALEASTLSAPSSSCR